MRANYEKVKRDATSFNELIRDCVIRELKRIISDCDIEINNTIVDPIEALGYINAHIRVWLWTVKPVINIDDELLKKIAEIKKPYVKEANKVIEKNIQKIIDTNSWHIADKISLYFDELSEKGIQDSDYIGSRRPK